MFSISEIRHLYECAPSATENKSKSSGNSISQIHSHQVQYGETSDIDIDNICLVFSIDSKGTWTTLY